MFWNLWWCALGALTARWWWRLPSAREYEHFLTTLGARGDLLRKRTMHYRDARLGLTEWRRRWFWRWRARRLRPGRALLLAFGLCLLWPLLTASAVVPQRTGCTEASALYVRRGVVEETITSNGHALRVPVGNAAGWSCISQAEADAAFAAAVAQVGGTQP